MRPKRRHELPQRHLLVIPISIAIIFILGITLFMLFQSNKQVSAPKSRATNTSTSTYQSRTMGDNDSINSSESSSSSIAVIPSNTEKAALHLTNDQFERWIRANVAAGSQVYRAHAYRFKPSRIGNTATLDCQTSTLSDTTDLHTGVSTIYTNEQYDQSEFQEFCTYRISSDGELQIAFPDAYGHLTSWSKVDSADSSTLQKVLNGYNAPDTQEN